MTFCHVYSRRFHLRSSHVRFFATMVSSSSSADANEVGRFSALAKVWWDENGPMKALHSMNRLRVPWIRDTLVRHWRHDDHRVAVASYLPLTGLRILDVGCGVGLLTEPLARLGASVIGIDASVESIEVAKDHASRRKDELGFGERLIYYPKTVEELVKDVDTGDNELLFHAVIASEVIEHVTCRETFVANCLLLTKGSGGCVFFTTINRTRWSRILAIHLAENVLRIVPRGMHDWEKFVSPDDLQFLVEKNGDCHVRLVHGMMYNPISNSWYWIRDTSVNFALCGVKS